MPQIDLHVHSNRSDGTYTPSQLVDYAMEKGLLAFALTDHDTVDGLEEAIHYARHLNTSAASVPEVIPGIEFSTEYQGKDIHILGLYIDYKNKSFQKKLQDFIDSRILRNRKMCALLQGAGIDITYEKLLAEFPDAVITRAHYARYLFTHGYIQSISEAFERYIGDHCRYFVPREKVTPQESVKLILEADGIPVLAHPTLYRMSDRRLEELVSQLKAAGLMGIEAVYSTYTPGEERQMRSLAAKYRLLITGGSDFHGANKPKIDLGVGTGKLCILADILETVKKSRANLLFTDMDGTLLLNDSTVSPAMAKALFAMTQKGHRLILTSGRPLPSILEVCEQTGFLKNGAPILPGMLVIANNGALIYDCTAKKPILEYRICQEDIAYIVQKAGEAGLHIHGYTEREIVWNPGSPVTGKEAEAAARNLMTGVEAENVTEDLNAGNAELRFYRRRIHLPLKSVPDIAGALPNGSYKLQLIHLTDKKKLEAFRDSILLRYNDRLQITFSNDQYLEILPKEAGKGNAVRFVTDYLPAMPGHTFAAGDAENDISMLQAAHTAIAMQNAAPEVKKAADIITDADNEHNGLLEILIRYFQ